ncbi:hypothetical protein CHITON_0970 [Thermococcus chitonophagus]|uniref:Uncharacterized protein n=1 Tax=Thermococcus chitonophagus TaxID=54262 RepID=A0A160VST8_9EURY|nr:hypothetical protein CHITON_0970 [Thermococcus chitonophagus]
MDMPLNTQQDHTKYTKFNKADSKGKARDHRAFTLFCKSRQKFPREVEGKIRVFLPEF